MHFLQKTIFLEKFRGSSENLMPYSDSTYQITLKSVLKSMNQAGHFLEKGSRFQKWEYADSPFFCRKSIFLKTFRSSKNLMIYSNSTCQITLKSVLKSMNQAGHFLEKGSRFKNGVCRLPIFCRKSIFLKTFKRSSKNFMPYSDSTY